jgi:hypothetical protein
VAPMAAQFVLPSREHADVVVRGDAGLEGSVAAVLEHAGRKTVLRSL